MNLDRSCQLFCLALLPILWLPHQWLIVGYGIAIVLWITALWHKSLWLGLCALLIAISYYRVIDISHNADIISAKRFSTQIEITRILHQQDYQTAIAKLASGETVFVNWQSPEPLVLGGYYQVELRQRPISARFNIGNFDRQRWYFANGIQRLTTVKKAERLPQPFWHLRANWISHTQQQLASLASRGLILALAFGERAWISQQDWQIFQHTSTAHLIAISGLHIALAFGFGFWLAKGGTWLLFYIATRKLKFLGELFPYICGLCCALGYSFLAGFAIPTLRALLAIIIILFCQFQRRYYRAEQLWWRVVVILLVIEPLSLLSDSFWLSILAVASLIFWYRFFPLSWWLPDCKKIGKLHRLLLSLLHLQIGITLCFTIIQCYFFEGISPIAFLANLLIVPLYSFLLIPLILFSLFTDNLFLSWHIVDFLAQFSLSLLALGADYWCNLSGSQQWQIRIINIAILCAIYIVRLQQRRVWFIALCLSLLMVEIGYRFYHRHLSSELQWINFDVGQGLSMAFIYQQNGQRKAIIYDTGASWNGGSMAELEILPYLQREGIDLVALFLSHDDNDHSGGVPIVLKHYPHTQFISTSQQRYTAMRHYPCLAGQNWQFGDWSFSAIFPQKITLRAKNQDSCILIAQLGQYRILLTGDIGKQQEALFVDKLGQIDFLQVGHHGSKTSSSEQLLITAQPKWAIISAGRWNPWHFPHHQVLARLQTYSIQSFITSEVGMVRVVFHNNSYRIETARDNWSPWYQRYLGN